MSTHVTVRPIGKIARMLDAALVPIMYLGAGTFSESPQQTHRWNYDSLDYRQTSDIPTSLMVSMNADPTATRHRCLKHLPILGGCRRYIVLEPADGYDGQWHVGWKNLCNNGITRIPVRGQIRMLQGPYFTWFFGVKHLSGVPIKIRLVGGGKIGDGGEYAQLPLL